MLAFGNRAGRALIVLTGDMAFPAPKEAQRNQTIWYGRLFENFQVFSTTKQLPVYFIGRAISVQRVNTGTKFWPET
jgi:hypothetical protein